MNAKRESPVPHQWDIRIRKTVYSLVTVTAADSAGAIQKYEDGVWDGECEIETLDIERTGEPKPCP